MIKLFQTDEARINYSAPYPVDIVYNNGGIVHEDYVVLYQCEIAVYEGDDEYSFRKYTLSVFDEDINEIRWVKSGEE